jgi:hypothetical protein
MCKWVIALLIVGSVLTGCIGVGFRDGGGRGGQYYHHHDWR